MENKLVIKGGKKLRGEVTISSSKNAAVAILPAVVLGSEIVKLYDVPHIEDVHVLIQLLQELNINVTTDKNNALVIDPTDMNNIVPGTFQGFVLHIILWVRFFPDTAM